MVVAAFRRRVPVRLLRCCVRLRSGVLRPGLRLRMRLGGTLRLRRLSGHRALRWWRL